MERKSKAVWVSRDLYSEYVCLWKCKPVKCGDEFEYPIGSESLGCVVICEKFFRMATGLEIKEGTRVRIRFAATVVK